MSKLIIYFESLISLLNNRGSKIARDEVECMHHNSQKTRKEKKEMRFLQHFPTIFLLFFSEFLYLITVADSDTHPDDVQALRHLKNGFDAESISPASCLSSWDFSYDPCDAVFTDRFTCGFRCDLMVFGFYRVTEITLDQAGYSGSLAHLSFHMPYLQTLDLSFNSVSGPIPVSFSNLTLLHRLALSSNSFTGPVPDSLGSLQRLQELYLDNNCLTGSVPRSINFLFSLKRLDLQQNNLSGELPDLSQLRNLCYVDLSDNQITGGTALDRLPPSIIELSLRNNSVRGDFRVNVAELRWLQVLDMSYNELSGTIPPSLFHHPCLQQLTISHNNFTWVRRPKNMGATMTSRLVAVDLSYNELHGRLPEFLAWMPELSALSLEHNKLSGTIPFEYALKAVRVARGPGTASFERLLLGGNYLLGPIPAPFVGIKPGTVNVSLVDNCVYRCPPTLFFCRGGNQKSLLDCQSFGPLPPSIT